MGHGPETINSEEKQRLVGQFFDTATSDSWRQALLAEYEIEYLFYGPNERALGNFSPVAAPYVQLVYDNGPVQLYQVRK